MGVTSHLVQRIWQHREGLVEGFTRRYGIELLVYYEMHPQMNEAIQREKQLKAWKRAWKIRLIERDNPHWQDLWEEIAGGR